MSGECKQAMAKEFFATRVKVTDASNGEYEIEALRDIERALCEALETVFKNYKLNTRAKLEESLTTLGEIRRKYMRIPAFRSFYESDVPSTPDHDQLRLIFTALAEISEHISHLRPRGSSPKVPDHILSLYATMHDLLKPSE